MSTSSESIFFYLGLPLDLLLLVAEGAWAWARGDELLIVILTELDYYWSLTEAEEVFIKCFFESSP
jgi:hypothetical protein